jgi:hypothetical protein
MFRTGEVLRSAASEMMQKRAMMKRKTTERKLKTSERSNHEAVFDNVSTFYFTSPRNSKAGTLGLSFFRPAPALGFDPPR